MRRLSILAFILLIQLACGRPEGDCDGTECDDPTAEKIDCPDADGDSICDDSDVCAGFDDNSDSDQDGRQAFHGVSSETEGMGNGTLRLTGILDPP